MGSIQIQRVRRVGDVDLTDHPIRVGRSSDNDLVLPSNRVSRHHCTIESIDGVPQVRDEGSRYGTMVNGVRIEGPTALADGDVIQVASFHLAVTAPEHPAPEREGSDTASAEIAAARAADLDERTRALEARASELDQREQERERAIDERAATLDDRSRTIGEREAALTAREQTLEEREATLTARVQTVEGREASVAERAQALEEREAALDERGRALDERSTEADRVATARIEELERTIQERTVAWERERTHILEEANQVAETALSEAHDAARRRLAQLHESYDALRRASDALASQQFRLREIESRWIETDERIEHAEELGAVIESDLVQRERLARELEEAAEARDIAVDDLQSLVDQMEAVTDQPALVRPTITLRNADAGSRSSWLPWKKD